MISFTSLFKRRGARLLVGLAATSAAAWLGAAFYTLQLNPEIQNFKQGARIKLAWTNSLPDPRAARLIVFGGSSSTFSFDGELALSEFSQPSLNLALGAGMGAKVLTRFAAAHARKGDTLVMAMEPALWIGTLEPPQLGTQFAIAFGEPSLAGPGLEVWPAPALGAADYLAALRPGGSHVVAMAAKILSRRELYRYRASDFLPSGQQTTKVRLVPTAPRGPGTPSAESRRFLAGLADWCRSREISLIYSIPWGYCPEGELLDFRRENIAFLAAVSEFMPVLEDERLGAYPVAGHFADTAWHLNREGAAIRTRVMLQALGARRLQNRTDILELEQSQAAEGEKPPS